MSDVVSVTAGTLNCPQCQTQVAAGLLACPACRWLVHGARLEQLSADAETSARRGDLSAALAMWQDVLSLLPAGSRQHKAVAARISVLVRDQAASEDHHAARFLHGAGWKWVTGLGAAGVLAWKLKFVLVFLITKGKLLLLGLTKSTTILSMLASFGVYWTQWGMWFALGLVLSIYVHEMGHVAALRRVGIPASAPMFIPGFGAMVRMHHAPATAHDDARVGLAGPLWGLGAAVAAYGWFYASGNPLAAAIGRTGAWLNLFNLLPVWHLDGGRGFAALTRTERAAATAAIGAAWVLTREGLLILLFLAAAMRIVSDSGAEKPDRGALTTYAFLTMTLSVLAVMHT